MSGRLVALGLTAALLGGCATKRDLRDLSLEVDSLRSSQEALLRDIQRQNAAILDSLSTQDVRLRGDLTNQLVQIERQLIQIQELTGQGQQALTEFRRTLREREANVRTQQERDVSPSDPGAADDLFATSEDALQRGSYATARAGFEEFVRAFSRHPRAAQAQLYVGESLERTQDPSGAVEAYGRVLELYPSSDQAPTALYRAALIEIERGNRDRARSMLNQVVAAYPRSPEAELARDRLGRLR